MKKTHDEFLKEATEINTKVTVIGQYVNSTTKVLVRCNQCGYQYYTIPGSVLSGHGCPKCARNTRISQESFLQRMEIINPKIEVLGLYKKHNSKIPVRCKICEYEWSPTAGSLLAGHGCPKCVGKARITHDEFLRRLALCNPKVEVLGNYQSLKEPVLVRCKTCGHEWKGNPKNLLNGSGCGICSSTFQQTHDAHIVSNTKALSECQDGHYKKTQEAFICELAVKAPTIEALSQYQNAHKRIKVRCRICGYEWLSSPHNLLNGYGCPICVLAGTSRVERFLFECFCAVFGKDNVVSRDTSSIGTELDIVIPRVKLAVEYGAWYWHKDKIEKDRNKRKACIEKDIRLITIYDAITDPAPFESDCYCFSDALSINSISTLIELVTKLFDDIGIDIRGKIDFSQIRTKVLQSSGIDKHMRFVSAVIAINPDIEIMGKYINANTSIDVKCKKCGYEWCAAPSNLKKGSGCPRCKGKVKRSNEQFLQELSLVNNQVEPLEDYVSANTKMWVRCKKCGREWQSTPSYLLHGQGCRKCAGTLKKSHEEFASELAEKNNRIEVLGQYVNTHAKILVRCRMCNFEWETMPSSLLRGSGCPNCAKNSNRYSQTKRRG